MINFVYKSIVSFLGLTVQLHLRLPTTLAECKTVLLCSDYISLLCTVANEVYHSTFFVALPGVELMILSILYLKWKNPVIDWAAKTRIP